MLSLFRKYIVPSIVFPGLLIFAGSVIRACLPPTSFRNLESSTIDEIVSRGMSLGEIQELIGLPDATSEYGWHYTNARKSFRTSNDYAPAGFTITFDSSGKCERILRGPIPK